MAQSEQILFKLARNAKMLGLTVNSQTQTEFVVENGSNDLTVTYAKAELSPAVVGGVDPNVSPWLGIGTATPGRLVIRGAGAANMAALLDTAVAAQVLAMVAALANDIELRDQSDAVLAVLRGHPERPTLGQ